MKAVEKKVVEKTTKDLRKRSRYRRWQRGAAWLLCFCMVLALTPGGALRIFGREESGLCPHHTAHDETCGYREAREAAPCGHIHTEACSSSDPEVWALYGISSDAVGPQLICPHSRGVHDETCGYREAQEAAACQFRCAICDGEAQEIIGWSWVDPEGMLQWVEEGGLWGLGLPGADADNPVNAEALAELLPKQIIVEVREQSAPAEELGNALPEDMAPVEESPADEALSGEPVLKRQQLDIAWDLSRIPAEGVWEGTYTLNASLPEGWVLAAEAPKLEVVVALGDSALFADDPSIKTKYFNRWNFEGMEGSAEPEFTVVVGDQISRAELIDVLIDRLPKRIYGWINPSVGNAPDYCSECFAYDKTDSGVYIDSDGSTKPVAVAVYGWLNIKYDNLVNEVPQTNWLGEFEVTVKQDFKEHDSGTKVPPNNAAHFYINYYEDGNKHFYETDSTKGEYREIKLKIKIVPINLDSFIEKDKVVEPPNTMVNLFDYWVNEDHGENPMSPQGDILTKSDSHDRYDIDETTYEPITHKVINGVAFSKEEDWNQGINKGRLLIFGDGVLHAGLWNKGAGSATPYGQKYTNMKGIVLPNLQDGWPVVDTAAAGERLADYTLVRDYQLAGECKGSPALDENVPVQNISETVMNNWNDDASLQYLFDPEYEDEFKKSYTDVKGLFQLDDEGYYYYNMRENFAEFVEEPDNNHFVLYKQAATTRTDKDPGQNESIGNFFPFNKGYQVFSGVNARGDLESTVASFRNSMNHHLGMTVELNFRQPAGGKIKQGSGTVQDMTFEFSGDDDVWVFIDDVLVLDIGGTHSELYGSINFATGDVYVGQGYRVPGIPDNPADGRYNPVHTNLKTLYEAAGKAGSTEWAQNNSTFASNTDHTLKMFYLERGNYDSSLALRFNLQPMLYQNIKKVDQDGSPIGGVSFELYAADEVAAGTEGAIYCRKPENGGEVYVKQAGAPLAAMTTRVDGEAQFIQADGKPFDFADRNNIYYVLREVAPPEGYRAMPIPVVLEYNRDLTLLTVANRWSTGAYSSFTSSIVGNNGITYGAFNEDSGDIDIDDSNPVAVADQQEGLVVAVPMLYEQSQKLWLALYGSNANGFNTVRPEKREAELWRKAVLEAVLRQAADNDAPQWYLSWNGDTKRLEGELQDLPGMAARYKLLNPNNADMKMVYAIIDKQALAELGITGNNAGERYAALGQYVRNNVDSRVKLDALVSQIYNAAGANQRGISFLNLDQFIQDFRSMIYIPNEQRELWVWKIDDEGRGINDVEFGLFDDEACTQLAASGTTARVDGRDGVLIFKPRPPADTAGYAQMVWANASQKTQYYLKEIGGVSGAYQANETVIPVVVGIYSVYADAGREDDGVSVMADVGRLAQTMRKYASDGEVNITLRDILAIGQEQGSGQFALDGWRDMALKGSPENSPVKRTLALHYKKNAVVDYGLHDEDLGEYIYPFFVADQGFVRARVEQNLPALTNTIYEGAANSANKEDLSGADLTNLFSLLNIVVVTNERTPAPASGALLISKELVGDNIAAADMERNFRFVVELTDQAGQPLGGSYNCYGTHKSGSIENGQELLLHHDESITILGLPVGTQFTVRETDNTGFNVRPSSGIISGAVSKGVVAKAEFQNSKDPFAGKNLTLRKEIRGEAAEAEREFSFVINLTNSSGSTLSGSFKYEGSKSGSIQSDEVITLKGGEYITIKNLPEGTVWAITEPEAGKDGYKTTMSGDAGTISGDHKYEAVFVNSKEPEKPDEPKKPEEPDKPKPPEEPDKPKSPDEPKTPDEPKPPVHPELPDPNDPDSPDTVTIYEDGVPKTYVKMYDPETEEYYYILEDEVPMYGWLEVPETGDSSHVALLLVVCAVSLGAVLVLLRQKPKKDNK